MSEQRSCADWLCALDVEYADFNARKTVGDARTSLFTTSAVDSLIVTTDTARASSYYNRVLNLTPGGLAFIDRALDRFATEASSVRIDVNVTHLPDLEAPLRSRNFTPNAEIVWLEADADTSVSAPSIVRPLPRAEVDRIRPILELDGRIDEALWADRRRHQCTEQFRTFVIEEDNEIAAIATTFVGANGAILGNAFTREGSRGLGYQRALIDARVADAMASGVARTVTDVEPDTTSLRNCERAGFLKLVRYSVWER